MAQIIGIVGGIGSYAALDLIRKIYDNAGARTDQDHLPIAMLSLPHLIEDRTKFLLGESTHNPGPAIARVIDQLHQTGATIIGIPCNTAHAPKIFGVIVSSITSKCKIIHLIREVVKYVKESLPHISTVGVLATNGTYLSRLYPHEFSVVGIDVVQPDQEIQYTYVHPAIYHPDFGIKSHSNHVTLEAKKNLALAAQHLIEKGAEAIILGCTELPLALSQADFNNCIIIDATTIYAQALIRESKAE